VLHRILVSLSLLCLITSVSAQPNQNRTPTTPDTLILGYNIAPPFVYEKEGELQGVAVWLWDQVVDEHRYVYELRQYPLDSLLKALAEGDIDASLSPLTITSDRSERMDFSPPYYIAYSSVMAPNATAFDRSIAYLRSFFSINFFRALGALVLVILIFGLLVWWFERKENEEEFGNGLKGLWNGFWWSAVTMTTVGYGDKSPKTIGGRVVALVWMFTAIVIISGFTAGIASSLTVNQLGWSGDKLEVFKDRKLGTVHDSGTESWLNNNFYRNLKSYHDMEALMSAMNEGEIDAIAYDRPILQELIKSDTLGRYQVLPITYNVQFYAMGFNPDLPERIQKRISTTLLEQIEHTDWKITLSEYDLIWK
jgi:ABC-type amino acid transport substrate-binding protein